MTIDPRLSELVRRNLQRVQERIDRAAEAASRDPGKIRLIGVSKYVGPEATAALAAAGCRCLGESRPQQLWEKAESSELTAIEGIEWRLIGHLQRNKVAKTVAVADSIDSVDSRRLLSAIDREAAAVQKQQRVLLEVNISGEPEKHGFTAADLPGVLQELGQWPHVEVCGLMAMAAREGGAAVARENFAALRELRESLASSAPDGVTLDELSMGMSGDLEQAIQEGSTLVRVGSALWEGIERG